MRVITWNINGLRAVLTKANQSLDEFLRDCNNADVICFQETKLTRSEMTEAFACPAEFDAFFSFSKVKKGYSGVATFVRTSTMETLAADTNACVFQEGRVVLTVHVQFVLVNVYCPTKAGDVERKMEFHQFLSTLIAQWREKYPEKSFVVVGDLNVIHRQLDACEEFTPYEATEWLESVLVDTPLVDSFRHFHPDQKKAYTCWSTLTGARETNFGVRLDYILADKQLVDTAADCWLWTTKEGSDHCPVVLDLNVNESTGKPTNAAECAKFFPEFAGVQQTLHTFLQDRQPVSPEKPAPKLPQQTWRQQSVASFFQAKSTKVAVEASVDSNDGESIQHLDEYQTIAASWKSILPGKAPPPPLCNGHKLPCLLRTVLKRNENYGRKFYLCCKPEGAPGDPLGRCNHFEWVPSTKNKRKIESNDQANKRVNLQ